MMVPSCICEGKHHVVKSFANGLMDKLAVLMLCEWSAYVDTISFRHENTISCEACKTRLSEVQ